MTKLTNEGWPEPTEWAQRLHNRLELLGADYMAAPWTIPDDPEAFTGLNLKQARATEIILAVASALRELPLFQKSNGIAALHDVSGALHDVVMGGSPRLFLAVPAGKRGGDGVHRNYLKVHVVLAVRFLVEAHDWSEKKARTFVADKFAHAGATGRKGNPLSPSTVQDWCERANVHSSVKEDVWIKGEVDRRLADLRSDQQWPGEVAAAMEWVQLLASDPLLASKYG